MNYRRLLYLFMALGFMAVSCGKNNPEPWNNNNNNQENNGNNNSEETNLPATIFSETFHSGLGKFKVDNKSKGGMSKAVWTFDSEHPEYGAVASGYDGGNRYTTEGWLVSPAIEIKSGYSAAFLRFNQALAYAYGEDVTHFIGLKISVDGGTSWVDKDIPFKPSANSRFQNIASGDITLTQYIGKTIQFAFVYKSDASTNQPTWEVMDVEISSEKKEIAKVDLGDEYTGVPAWMELPAVQEGDDFHIHTAPIDQKNHRNYSFVYDGQNLVANWVAYPLNDMYLKHRVERTDAWADDPFVSLQAIYYSAGNIYNDGQGGTQYNRGHQLPSADRLCSEEMNKQTFYFTNIAPQMAGDKFNAGIWGQLEDEVRKMATSKNGTDTLYVVTGCAVNAPLEIRKDNDGKDVPVPNAFFKAVLRLGADKSYKAAAFWLEHIDYSPLPGAVVQSYAKSIDELEEMTGIDFFVNLPEDIRDEVEAQNPVEDNFWWNLQSN